MAHPIDYVGKTFGQFTIEAHVDAGTEAEVYACVDHRTDQVYALRLSVDDADLWEGDPVIPPHNRTIELPNVEGGRALARTVFEAKIELGVVPIYALRERLLIPVAAPIRPKNAWSVDRFLSASTFERLGWHDVLKTLSFATTSRGVDYTALDANVLMWIIAAVYSRTMSLAEMEATLACRHFRANVGAEDIESAILVREILRHSAIGFDTELQLMTLMLLHLQDQPLQACDQREKFEIAAADPDANGYSLFLQEFFGADRPFPTVTFKR